MKYLLVAFAWVPLMLAFFAPHVRSEESIWWLMSAIALVSFLVEMVEFLHRDASLKSERAILDQYHDELELMACREIGDFSEKCSSHGMFMMRGLL